MSLIDVGNNLLSIEGLEVTARRRDASRVVLDRVDLAVPAGRITGLAGESGSGKSMLALAIAGLLPPGCAATAGRIRWRGEDLLQADAGRLAAIRGAQIAYVFQEPMTALNPTLRIGRQLVDVIVRHLRVGSDAAREIALGRLRDVQIPDASVMERWPHQLSGGMRQRVMIAMAFACKPALIVADEPTTALDVTIRAQILEMLTTLARDSGTAVLLITHDVAVIDRVCEEVNVLYAGRIMERGATDAVIGGARHPYTRGLLACLPERSTPGAPLTTLPLAVEAMPGCVFRPRCVHAYARCADAPGLLPVAGSHAAACWRVEEGVAR